jgi:hypothetical protein
MSKRIKITFETINKGNYTVIDPKDIAKVNENIKKAMTPIIQDFEKKQFESWIQAGKNINFKK